MPNMERPEESSIIIYPKAKIPVTDIPTARPVRQHYRYRGACVRGALGPQQRRAAVLFERVLHASHPRQVLRRAASSERRRGDAAVLMRCSGSAACLRSRLVRTRVSELRLAPTKGRVAANLLV